MQSPWSFDQPLQQHGEQRPAPTGRLAMFLMERAKSKGQATSNLGPVHVPSDKPPTLSITPQSSTLSITPQFSTLSISSQPYLINRLPAELLVMVFEFLLIPDSKARWDYYIIHKEYPPPECSPATLSLVCRNWRDLVYSTPPCWMFIQANCPSFKPNFGMELQRSQPYSKLVVEIHFGLDHPTQSTQDAYLHDSTWQILGPHWDRVTDLALIMHPDMSFLPWHSYSKLIPMTLPNLRWLTINTTLQSQWDILCPRLENVATSWSPGQEFSPYKRGAHQPETLHIFAQKTAVTLLSFLNNSCLQGLGTLSVHLDAKHLGHFSNTSPTSISLPNLFSLSVTTSSKESGVAAITLIRTIHAPQLRYLTVPALIPHLEQTTTSSDPLDLPLLDSLHIQVPNPFVHSLLYELSKSCTQLSILHISGAGPQDRWSGIWKDHDLFPNVSELIVDGISLALVKEFVVRRLHSIKTVQVDWRAVTLPANAHHLEFRMLQENIDAIGPRLVIRNAWQLSGNSEGRCRTWDEAMDFSGKQLNPRYESDTFVQWYENAGIDGSSFTSFRPTADEEMDGIDVGEFRLEREDDDMYASD
ncbi:hypothetical protein FRC02_008650 [Tulasnella sp. 418]|nr:hypothetical protein FRC02_008650 [Tulasnella sp. 418]